MLSKKERVLKYLNEGKSEHTLCSFWHHFPSDKWYGEQAVKAHLDFFHVTDIDFLKVMEEVRYDFNINNASDWSKYIPPKRNTAHRQAHCDVIKRISDSVGDECLIYTTIFDPLRTVGIVKGYKFVESHIKENQKAVADAFNAMAYSIAEYAADCIEAGADGIYFSSKGAEKGRFREDAFVDIVYTPDRFVCESISERSGRTILHICGYDTELRYYRDFPVETINWDCHNGSYDISKGAEVFPKMVILGGVDNKSRIFTSGSDSSVESEINSILDSFKAPNRFILGADCTLPEDVRPELVKAAVDACHRYNRNK